MNASKPALFRAYNAARAATQNDRRLDLGRINRALGIVQRRTTIFLADGRLDIAATGGDDFYLATWRDCQCEDVRRHGAAWWCKHRLAAALVERARQYDT